jgi:protein gp37
MSATKIEWTEKTWNPFTGCTKISTGCKHCYAEVMANRLQAMGSKGYDNGFKFTVHPERLAEPYAVKNPSLFFVCSMSDLFHGDASNWQIETVMNVIEGNPRHTFQILTKRAERMADFFDIRAVPDNVWLGVTVEDKKYGLPRIEHLQRLAPYAPVTFLSIEPLLEPLGRLDLDMIDWVIVGGESGTKARPMNPDWVRSIRDQCVAAKVPFFFKQWGGKNKKEAGCLLDGKEWKQMPAGLMKFGKMLETTERNMP